MRFRFLIVIFLFTALLLTVLGQSVLLSYKSAEAWHATGSKSGLEEALIRCEFISGARKVRVSELENRLHETGGVTEIDLELLGKEAVIEHARQIIQTQGSYIDFMQKVMKANGLNYPEIIYPQPNPEELLEELFREEVIEQ